MLRPILGTLLLTVLAAAGPATAQIYTYQSTLGVTDAAGNNDTHFSNPVAGAVDTVNGHFFVADTLNSRVQVFDTTSLLVVATLGVTDVAGTDNAHFNQAHSVEFDAATDRIFVADTGNERVQVFNAANFDYVGTIGVTGYVGYDNTHFDTPGAVHVNPVTHQLYVADIDNARIQVFDAGTFAYVGTLGTSGIPGTDNAHLDEPNDAQFNPTTNQIMVADTGNSRLQLFDATTLDYVGTITVQALDPDGYIANVLPVTAAFDPLTNLVLVADIGENERVQVFDATTYKYVTTLGTTGVAGPGNNEFYGPFGISVDPAHNRLFIGDDGNDRIQVFSVAPVPLVASVLPGSRSVELGNAATIFATMINASTSALSSCQIALPDNAPAGLTLSYQTTNPATNTLIGSPNTPVTIAANDGLQTFLLTFQGSTAFSVPGMALDFDCAGAAPAAIVTGVDTVDLTLSSSPVADIIALSATATSNGIAELPEGGVGAFAVASINVGTTAAITVSVDTGTAALPLTATICETNPSNGQCLAPPAASVTLNFAGEAAPTFSVFLQSSGAIPFAPASSRVFVQFKDASGGLHGSTSVAVETN